MKSIYSVSRKSLEQYFIDKKMPKFRATQVFEGLYKQDVDNLFDIKGLKKEVMTMLNDDFYFNKLEIVEKNKADDGTTKYLFKLEDGSLIETVLMVHNYGYSVCVSTQVGCNMGCSFCASGEVKKIRNLTPDEMLLQVKVINDDLKKQELRVTNVVMMGIGEPFDNFENVLEFIRIINDDRGLEIGARHITVSTCGIAPKIIEFANFPYQVNLAISLHFATNIKRSKYMKINNTYSLESIIEALKFYYQKTNRRITFEYIMLKGINDSIEDAEELAKLVSQFNCYINLIPYNDTDNKFKRSDDEQVRKFFDHLKKKNLNVTRRREQGSEIAAACGQLRVNKLKEKI
ncbi:MAG TPA: 23S rRNA (adenine(2503)-C(2))-methyltransferase RlmN [Acholeplasmataceae bacterium]|nr:23S rRNA (adenine(2503)-C(2))-methyltransferase RlmN [Acholeplasmataceae bacterium]